MKKNIRYSIEQIRQSIIKNSDDSLYEIEEEIEKIKTLEGIDISIVSELLSFYEEYPHFDFGMPGALTHYLETFYQKGYEEKLVTSIKRKPTHHTLWMLNRVINGTEKDSTKDFYIQILKAVATNDKVELSLQELANEYISLHK